MQNIKRKILLSVVLLLGALPVAAQELETDKLALGFGIDLPFAVHIVAMEKGWFADAGFSEVTTKSFSAGVLAGEALVAGEIQLWTPGNLPPISMFHNGIPVVIIGTDSVNTGLEKLVVRKDAKISQPEDLYNIKIGLLLGSTSGAMLANIAEHYGLDPARLQAVNLAPPEALASMAAGEIQGLLCWEPWPYRALNEIESEVIHTGTTSYFAQNRNEAVQVSNNRSMWVASQEFVRDNPKATQSLVEILLRAQQYVADPANKDEVLKRFSDYQKQDLAMNQALYSNYQFNPVFDDNYVKDMEAIADFLERSGRIKNRTPILDYTYTVPTAAVDSSLVKVEGKWKP